MNIKELKEAIKDLPDNIEIVIDNGYAYFDCTYFEYNKYDKRLQIGKGDINND